MAGITSTQAEAKLEMWLAAEEKVAAGQSYSIGTRQLTRANLGEIRESVTYWSSMATRLSRGGIRVMRAVPLD